MRVYLIKRLLLAVVTLIGISVVVFIMSQLIPGSPISMALYEIQQSAGPGVDTEKLTEDLLREYGFDQPIHIRYLNWLGGLLQLDLGHSFKDKRPVWDKIKERFPVSLQLSFISLLLAYLIAVPLGVFSAVRHQSLVEQGLTLFLFILYSLPNFWVGTLMLMLLSGGEFLDLFPIGGLSSRGAEDLSPGAWILDRSWHLVLPVICLTYGSLAYLSRYAKTGMLEVIRQDYMTTARAKGLPESKVILKHGLRNSLIPIITLAAMLVPAMIGGSVIVETIFNLPGMGQLGFEAILSRDYPVIMGLTTCAAVLTLIGLILSDVLYVLVDPRISFEKR